MNDFFYLSYFSKGQSVMYLKFVLYPEIVEYRIQLKFTHYRYISCFFLSSFCDHFFFFLPHPINCKASCRCSSSKSFQAGEFISSLLNIYDSPLLLVEMGCNEAKMTFKQVVIFAFTQYEFVPKKGGARVQLCGDITRVSV